MVDCYDPAQFVKPEPLRCKRCGTKLRSTNPGPNCDPCNRELAKGQKPIPLPMIEEEETDLKPKVVKEKHTWTKEYKTQYQREYREKNREKTREDQRRYRAENLEHYNQIKKDYYQANKEKFKARNAARRARIKAEKEKAKEQSHEPLQEGQGHEPASVDGRTGS